VHERCTKWFLTPSWLGWPLEGPLPIPLAAREAHIKAWACPFLHRRGAPQNLPRASLLLPSERGESWEGKLYTSACCCVLARWRWAQEKTNIGPVTGLTCPSLTPGAGALYPPCAHLSVLQGERCCSVLGGSWRPSRDVPRGRKLVLLLLPLLPCASPRDSLKTVVGSPEPPGQILLGWCLCCLPDSQWERHAQRLVQTWRVTQFFVILICFVLVFFYPPPSPQMLPWPMQPVLALSSPHALGAWTCLATPSGHFQHENSLFRSPDPLNSLAIPLHSGDTSSPLKCHWKTLLNLCATPSRPSPLLPCAVIALVAVGSSGARLSWEAGHGLLLRRGIRSSALTREASAWARGVRASAPARSSASPLSLLTRVPISVSRTGSRWWGHLCAWAMRATASPPPPRHSCQMGTALPPLTCAPLEPVI